MYSLLVVYLFFFCKKTKNMIANAIMYMLIMILNTSLLKKYNIKCTITTIKPPKIMKTLLN